MRNRSPLPLVGLGLTFRLTLLALGSLLLLGTSAHAQSGRWTNVPHGLSTTAFPGSFGGVAFGNGVFVATGANLASGTVPVAYSTDGTTWTASSITPTFAADGFNRVRFLNGRFIVAAYGTRGTGVNAVRTGSYYTSTDGRTWSPNDVATNVSFLHAEIEYGNGRYVIVGGNGFLFGSTDLTNWTALTSNLTGIFSYQDVAFGNGRWFITTNGGGTVATSTDGQNFTSVSGLAGAAGGYRVEYGNGIWFFYSQIDNAVSTDGVTFTPVVRSLTTPGGTGTIRFANGRFISPGSVATPFQASLDGRAWFSLGAYPAVTSIFTATYDFAFGNGKYITAGSITPSIAQLANPTPIIYTIAESDVPAPATPPAITTPVPATLAAVLGRSATLSVAATGSGNTYVWRKNTGAGGTYVAIPGATAATYTIPSVTAASAGSYTVVITNSLGTVTSTPIVLSLVPAAQAGRLINLSVLTDLATAADEFTLGYVVGGAGTSGPKPLVIRAAGPSLGALGVAGTLSDPKLETFAGSTKTGENDNWGGSASLTADLAAVGAFAYTGPTSRDSAVSASITTRDNSVKVTGVGGATGQVIAEVYDATPAASFATTTPRLLNVSVNKHLGTGLTAGFVLGGTTPTRVLIRVVGPGLAAFGVGGTVADPQLALFNSSSAKIAENNDWAGGAELTAAFNSVGAFALAPTSRDAALLISLPPGGYSVQASGVNNTTGTALVEVYEVP